MSKIQSKKASVGYRVISSDGAISEAIFDFVSRDYKYIATLHRRGGPEGATIRMHPSRLLPLHGDAQVEHKSGALIANCPKCEVPASIDIKSAKSCSCHKCGKFSIGWHDIYDNEEKSIIIPIKKPEPPKIKEKVAKKPRKTTTKSDTPVQIDFDLIKKLCEIWVKGGIPFDYVQFDVRAHVIIVVSDNPRKWCFNSYNGTWGRHSRQADLKNFIADAPDANGKAVGWPVKNLIDERRKLEKSGYEQIE